MGNDYIPKPDSDFAQWFETFSAYVAANAGALGVMAAQATEVADARTDWLATLADHRQAQAAAQAATDAKDASREEAESLVRPLVKFIQARTQTTDGQRQGLGITIPSTSRTQPGMPTTRPLLMVDASKRLEHTLSLRDETTPNSRSRPEGAVAAEVWCYVNGTPPTDPTQCQLAAVASRNIVRVEFKGEQAGKNAHYMVRWVNSRGEKGPWSDTGSATIAA